MSALPRAPWVACAAALAALSLSSAASASAAPLDLEHLSAAQAESMLKNGSTTSVELTKAYIDRITALNKRGPALNAVTQYDKQALTQAAAADKRRASGTSLGPADGLPILLKDIVDAKGEYTSAGNYSLRNSFPAEDSGVTKKLREHGLVILGKAGLSEFANSFGNQPSGFSNLTGQVLNALDADATPSGSSSGTGAAINAGMAPLGIGTETSGSIISPSQAESLVGLRPTVGLVPGYGIAPILASQDTAGPMERTVTDAAMTMQSIAGADPEADQEYRDVFGSDYLAKGIVPTPPSTVPDYLSALDPTTVRGKRIGYVLPTLSVTNTESRAAIQTAIDVLTAAGATMVAAPTQVTTPPTCTATVTTNCLPAVPASYEAHKTIDAYYAHLGPDAPIQSMLDEVADNAANAQEALKFGNATHLAESQTDISAGGSNEQQFRSALPIRKAFFHKSIDDMLTMGTSDPSDDVIAIVGSIGNGPAAGYPQITIPMGYTAAQRRPLSVSVNGGAYSEKDLLGVGYVIEQGTKLRQSPSELNPSMYRCTKTAVAPEHADTGSCNPDYDTIMAKVGARPGLGFSLETATISDLQTRLNAGTLTSEDVTKAYLARIALSNAEGPGIQAVREVSLDAIDQAKAADAKRAADGQGGILSGIPVLVNDSLDVRGMPTTAGSIALKSSVPSADSRIVAKLRTAGAIILGKTNVTEMNGVSDANMPEGYSALGGQVLLPGDTDKTPAGSSAGSAAATASGLAAATIGLETSTDTAQLIAPAGVSGVVGFKPSVGLVSRTGELGVARSQDSPGPIARTVTDAATTMQAIAGRDAGDPATTSTPATTIGTNYLAGLRTGALQGKKIAVIDATSLSLNANGSQQTLPEAYTDAVAALRSAGATTTVKSFGPYAAPTTTSPILTYEFKRDLHSYLSGIGGGGAKSLQQVIDANNADPVEGLKYQQGELIAAQNDTTSASSDASTVSASKSANATLIDNLLTNGTASDTTDDFDAIMLPNAAVVSGENPQIDVANKAGYPMLTVPAAFGTGSQGRNPIGVTFIGTAYSDAKLLADGYAFEQATNVRRAPSTTNPSMWRCVAGSTFFSPHHCNPGDRQYVNAFAPPPTTDAPTTSTTPPAGTTPATMPKPGTTGTSAAARALDAKQLTALRTALTKRLAKGNVLLSFKERFLETGTVKYTLRLTIPKRTGHRASTVSLGSVTLKVTKVGTVTVELKLSKKARQTLTKYPKGTLRLRTVFTSKATGSHLTTSRTIRRATLTTR